MNCWPTTLEREGCRRRVGRSKVQGGSLRTRFGGVIEIRDRAGRVGHPRQPWGFVERKKDEVIERMRKNSHSRWDCNIMLGDQACEARTGLGRVQYVDFGRGEVNGAVQYCAQRGRMGSPCPLPSGPTHCDHVIGSQVDFFFTLVLSSFPIKCAARFFSLVWSAFQLPVSLIG